MSTTHIPPCPACDVPPSVTVGDHGRIVISCPGCGHSVRNPRRIAALCAWRSYCRGVEP